MQQITSLYRYVVLVFNATNKSIYDQEKKQWLRRISEKVFLIGVI